MGGVAYARDCNRATRDAAARPAPVLIVMDASRSMAKPVGGARGSRLDAAKRALRTVVDGAARRRARRPAALRPSRGRRDARRGLPRYRARAAGRATRSSRADRRDRAVRAVGSTPIGRALRAAASDLPASGPASIVLVSDGGDNCAPPDPCVIAGELAAEGRDLHIEAIGFQVSGRARRQLRCIAAKGRGVYREAADADEPPSHCARSPRGPLERTAPTGTAVRGGATDSAAAEIGTGRYLDRIGADGERWYALELRTGQPTRCSRGRESHLPVQDRQVHGPARDGPVHRPLRARRRLSRGPIGVPNLFYGDESTESDGLLSQPVGPRADPAYRPSRPGRWLLRISLNDNGLGTLANVLEGVELPRRCRRTSAAAKGRRRRRSRNRGAHRCLTHAAPMSVAAESPRHRGSDRQPPPGVPADAGRTRLRRPRHDVPATSSRSSQRLLGAATVGVEPRSLHAVVGGSSFDDAPLLHAGTYNDTIVPQETLFYAVALGTGQRPRVDAEVDLSGGSKTEDGHAKAAVAFTDVPERHCASGCRRTMAATSSEPSATSSATATPGSRRGAQPAAADRRNIIDAEAWKGPGIYTFTAAISDLDGDLGAFVSFH